MKNGIASGLVVRDYRAFGHSLQIVRCDDGSTVLLVVRVEEQDSAGYVSGPIRLSLCLAR